MVVLIPLEQIEKKISSRHEIGRWLSIRVVDAKGWYKKWMGLRKHSAWRRLPCTLSLWQYIALATKAGLTRPAQVGTASDSYHMSRVGDVGGYDLGNCRFLLHKENRAEQNVNGGQQKRSLKIRGRTKHTHSSLMEVSEQLSKSFRVRSPCGKVFKGKNLYDFCKDQALNQGHMSAVCRGVKGHHKGWTGEYIDE